MSEAHPSGDLYQTTLINNGWYTLHYWWSEYDELKTDALTGQGDEVVLGENTTWIQVEGPGGTKWNPVAGKNRTYTWSGPIWDQKVDGDFSK